MKQREQGLCGLSVVVAHFVDTTLVYGYFSLQNTMRINSLGGGRKLKVESGGNSMAVPATARIIPISDISASKVGEKFRLFGVLVLPDDPTSNIARLHSLTASKHNSKTSTDGSAKEPMRRENGLGLLIDISLCMDEGIAALKESASVVMVMGTLEYNTVGQWGLEPVEYWRYCIGAVGTLRGVGKVGRHVNYPPCNLDDGCEWRNFDCNGSCNCPETKLWARLLTDSCFVFSAGAFASSTNA
jgi:hypothetical protein